MKDIAAIIIFCLVWNSEVHEQHPTLIPVLVTVYVVLGVLEFVLKYREEK